MNACVNLFYYEVNFMRFRVSQNNGEFAYDLIISADSVEVFPEKHLLLINNSIEISEIEYDTKVWREDEPCFAHQDWRNAITTVKFPEKVKEDFFECNICSGKHLLKELDPIRPLWNRNTWPVQKCGFCKYCVEKGYCEFLKVMKKDNKNG